MEKETNITVEQAGGALRWRVDGRSSIGGRSEQQDCAYAYVGDRQVFAVVCDGVGGGACGGDASRAAVESMKKAFMDHGAGSPEGRPGLLHRAMVAADAAVGEAIAHQSGGTTLVSILLCDDCLHWVSVGDSRLYIFRDGELVRATRDHNYALRLREKLDRGEIDQAEFERESKRGDALISYLGSGKLEPYDLTQRGFRVQKGDALLLTTDGLYKGVREESLKEVLGGRMDTRTKADMLQSVLSGQLARSKQDNTTFIIIDIL